MDLTDEQWEAIRRHVPGEECQGTSAKGGRPWRDPRDVLNGILWVLRTGAPWADLPSRYPPYQTCHRRFQKWVTEGVLHKILRAIAEDLRKRGKLEEQWSRGDDISTEDPRQALRRYRSFMDRLLSV